MKQDDADPAIDQVVKRLMPLVRKHATVGKKEFEGIHAELLNCIHENTKISMDVIVEKMDTVITALPSEYGVLPEAQRSWEALIAYLYTRYLKELGN